MKTSLTIFLFLLLQLCAIGRDSFTTNEITPPLSVNLGPDQFFCEGDNTVVSLSAAVSGASYSLYSWSTGENTQDITIDLIDLPVGAHEFSVEVEINAGTTAAIISRDTVVITKVGVPLVEIIDNSICSGEAVEIHFTGEDFGPVELSIYLNHSGDIITVPMATSPFFALPDVGTYTILSVSNALCTAGQILGNNILTVDALCLNLGPDLVFCEGDNSEVVLDAGPGFHSYLWDTGETTQTITVSLVSLGVTDYDFTVTVTDGAGATGDETVRITKVGVPLVELVDNNICFGEPVEIDFTGEEYGPVVIQVLFPDGSGPWPIAMNSSRFTALPDSIGTYEIVSVSSNLCPAGQIIGDNILTVGGAPEVDLGNDQQICAGSSINLGNLALPPDSYSFEWYEGVGGALIGTDGTISVSPTMTTTYQLIVTDDLSSCSAADEVIIYPFICDKDPVFTGGLVAAPYSNEIAISTYPNPFSTKATLELFSAVDDHINISLYNLQGQQVQHVYTGAIKGGEMHYLSINGLGLENGVYFFQIQSQHELLKTGTIIYEK